MSEMKAANQVSNGNMGTTPLAHEINRILALENERGGVEARQLLADEFVKLRSALGQQAEQIDSLRSENSRLKQEVAELHAKLDQLREEEKEDRREELWEAFIAGGQQGDHYPVGRLSVKIRQAFEKFLAEKDGR